MIVKTDIFFMNAISSIAKAPQTEVIPPSKDSCAMLNFLHRILEENDPHKKPQTVTSINHPFCTAFSPNLFCSKNGAVIA